jgi:hypothetical protein
MGVAAGFGLLLNLEKMPPVDEVDVLGSTGVLVPGVGALEESGGLVVVDALDKDFSWVGIGEVDPDCGGELTGVKVDRSFVLGVGEVEVLEAGVEVMLPFDSRG